MAPLSEARTPVRSVTDVVRESFITGVAVAGSGLDDGLSGEEIETDARPAERAGRGSDDEEERE